MCKVQNLGYNLPSYLIDWDLDLNPKWPYAELEGTEITEVLTMP